ncbi:MAG: hypothetical protein V4649_10365 [Bacteroidota bacterium]
MLVRSIPTLLLIALPFFSMGAEAGSVYTGATITSFFNLVLLATSAVSIKQFFWPGEEYNIPFHVFNILFTIAFYAYSLTFLVHHKDYYPNFQGLSTAACVVKFFFSSNIFSLGHWLIAFAVVINFIYIARHSKDFYKA